MSRFALSTGDDAQSSAIGSILRSTRAPPHDHRCLDAAPECRLDRESDVRIVASMETRQVVGNSTSHPGHACRDGWCGRLRRYALRVAGGPMISNDEVAQYCRAYPDRFIGIASVDLFRPMEGVRELRLRVKRDGFKGLRVLPWVWSLPPDDRRYYPLFAECCELDVPFCTAGSTGRRNTGVKSLCWCFKLQGLTWSFV